MASWRTGNGTFESSYAVVHLTLTHRTACPSTNFPSPRSCCNIGPVHNAVGIIRYKCCQIAGLWELFPCQSKVHTPIRRQVISTMCEVNLRPILFEKTNLLIFNRCFRLKKECVVQPQAKRKKRAPNAAYGHPSLPRFPQTIG